MIIEHLERTSPSDDHVCQYPTNYTDVQNVDKEQILPVVIQAHWACNRDDKCTHHVSSVCDVIKCFVDFV